MSTHQYVSSSSSIRRVFAYGFPAFYGGATTEFHHQILAWLAMGMKVHLIPIHDFYPKDALHADLLRRGVVIHKANDWKAIKRGDVVLSFGNPLFFEVMPAIRRRTKRTAFINCMTWLFKKEQDLMAKGHIAMFLYQNEEVRRKNMPILKALNPAANVKFMTFTPYFEMSAFPFVGERSGEFFGCGRISRDDVNKISENTLHIYEYFVSPKVKKGLFLGFGERSMRKAGKPFDWIRTAENEKEVSQQEFYRHCDVVLQPMDTTENWPRIGLEAMSSGSVLVVDNRGGWRQMVEHGKTGWLCDNERDFIYYASKMAFERHMREDMACAARERVQQLASLKASAESWREVFCEMSKLPA